MPTVRCPSCRRPLNLPEDTLADTAQCPLCESVFAVADLDVQRPRPPRPLAPAVPVGAREVPVPRAEERDLPADEGRLRTRRALGTAAGWLKAMVAFGLFQMATCGLCGCIEADRSRSFAFGRGASLFFHLYAAWWIVRVVVLVIIWAGAERLSRGRGGAGLARAGAILALIYALLTVVITLPALYELMEDLGQAGRRRVRPTVWVSVSLTFTYITAMCGLIGAVLALRQLARPEVEQAFRR
jgi:LSD1 subclass zinc finger protein